MPQKADMTLGRLFEARYISLVHNFHAIKDNRNYIFFSTNFLPIPLPHRFKVTAFGCCTLINRSMKLGGLDLGVFLCAVIEDLNLKSVLGGIPKSDPASFNSFKSSGFKCTATSVSFSQ